MTVLITTDPVCGMAVKDSAQALRSSYGGQTYLFCSSTCQDRFLADPQRFGDGASPADA